MDNEQPHEPDERERPGSGPVTVRVARSAQDWTGRRDVEVITADGVLAAQMWDERCWRRA